MWLKNDKFPMKFKTSNAMIYEHEIMILFKVRKNIITIYVMNSGTEGDLKKRNIKYFRK